MTTSLVEPGLRGRTPICTFLQTFKSCIFCEDQRVFYRFPSPADMLRFPGGGGESVMSHLGLSPTASKGVNPD